MNNQIDLKNLEKSGQILKGCLKLTEKMLEPGISQLEIEKAVKDKITKHNAKPAFLNYPGAKKPYPAATCISVNEEVVHSPPQKRKLAKEDLVSIDMGVNYKGMITDAARSWYLGEERQKKQLLQTTEKALDRATKLVRPGLKIGELGYIISKTIKKGGFSVVKELTGHGVGTSLHEPPTIYNFGLKQEGEKLKEGQVIAIEPIATLGKPGIETGSDGWTITTKDNSVAAHFENSILVTDNGFQVLTN